MTEYMLYTQTTENNMNLPKSRCIFAQLCVKTETENMRNKILLNVVACEWLNVGAINPNHTYSVGNTRVINNTEVINEVTDLPALPTLVTLSRPLSVYELPLELTECSLLSN